MKPKFENIVAFCILMEGNGGILNKAPIYIAEKYSTLINYNLEDPSCILDANNKRKFNDWVAKWS